MKTALGLLGLLSVGVFVLAGTAGCEVACTEDEEKRGTTCVAKSLTYYTDPALEADKSAAWATGGSITINSDFGHVHVVAGSSADTVSAHFLPFSYRAHDAKDAAMTDIRDGVKFDVVASGSNVEVSTWMADGEFGNSAGAQIDVTLPANFDGALIVHNYGRGNVSSHDEYDVNIDSVVNATSLDVSAADLGGCKILGATSVTKSDVHCGDFVGLYDVSDTVNASTTFNAVIDNAIEVKLNSISATGGGTITSADGTIVVSLPTTGLYTVQATSAADGTVNVNGQPADCSVTEAASTSKTLACGTGGPTYTVSAGTDDLGDGDVYLKFQ